MNFSPAPFPGPSRPAHPRSSLPLFLPLGPPAPTLSSWARVRASPAARQPAPPPPARPSQPNAHAPPPALGPMASTPSAPRPNRVRCARAHDRARRSAQRACCRRRPVGPTRQDAGSTVFLPQNGSAQFFSPTTSPRPNRPGFLRSFSPTIASPRHDLAVGRRRSHASPGVVAPSR
jgi:hypothetical protein